MSKIDGNGSPASAEWLHIGTKCCCEFAYVGSSFAVSARNLTLKNSASLGTRKSTTPSSLQRRSNRPEDKDRLTAKNIHCKQTARQICRKPAKMLDSQGISCLPLANRWNTQAWESLLFLWLTQGTPKPWRNQTFTWTALTRATP
ncbi:uncharacterized protein [Montipora foliosa]|uniref:uncharacterized protein isoform X2 n=1 Tax=Montipora foliosa TaxID=591990 RepID=UPI0035F18D83